MSLELDIDQITAAIKHWMKHLAIPIDWERGITFLAYDGKDDPEPLLVEDLRAHMEIRQQAGECPKGRGPDPGGNRQQ